MKCLLLLLLIANEMNGEAIRFPVVGEEDRQPWRKPRDTIKEDRFIPNRETLIQMGGKFSQNTHDHNDKETTYCRALKTAVFGKAKQTRLISSQENDINAGNFIGDILTETSSVKHTKVSTRVIAPTPERILDAPDIEDDYYLNLMDWSSWDQLGICLKNKVYLYAPTGIEQLCEEEESNTLCSISFHQKDKRVAVGTTEGKINIFDLERNQLVRTLKGHYSRVSSLSFSNLIFSGSKDTMVLAYDIRAPREVVRRLNGHRGEVCGMKNGPSGLATGSNDNIALIWDISMGKVKESLLGHKGAVKALDWCPWQRNVLATGGGTADKSMKFWNVDTGKCLNTVNTMSQVCSLLWNPSEKEILSSHGYTDNQLCLWKVGQSMSSFPQLSKIQEFHGHSQRVLHMSLSPDESTVCSASADETLRFWRIFNGRKDGTDFSRKFS